jgi:hypothetical protein
MPDQKLTKLLQKNLLYSIYSAVGSELFRHIFVRDQTGKEFDALKDGRLSCAYVVSSILALHGLIDRPHATVTTTIKKMQEAGWYKVDAPNPGDIVYWPPDADNTTHLGFYFEKNTYFSNSSRKRRPVFHKMKLRDGRLPDAYYTHKLLREE